MVRLIVTSCASAALTLLVISLLVFVGTNLLPGDVADALLGQAATPEATAALRAALHLNDPAWLRYLHWLGGAADRRSRPFAGQPGRRSPA